MVENKNDNNPDSLYNWLISQPHRHRSSDKKQKVTYTNALTVDGYKRLSFLLQQLPTSVINN